MKRKLSLSIASICVFCLFLTMTVFAHENEELTPIEIDELLNDVTPVEVSPGVYLRENGDIGIYDIDVSKFEPETTLQPKQGDGEIVPSNMFSTQSWDLSTPYIASFKAKYRVFSQESFTGYSTIYVSYTDVVCPSDSKWKSAIYIGWDSQASSAWLSSSKTTYVSKFSNLNKKKSYNVVFEKTDNKSQATGIMEVYLP